MRGARSIVFLEVDLSAKAPDGRLSNRAECRCFASGREAHSSAATTFGRASLPYADATFDAIVCNFGIHHVPQPRVALREAYRVLRSGGRLAFTVWTTGDENIGLALLNAAIKRHGDPTLTTAPPAGPDRVRSIEECIRALEETGFRQVRADTVSRT